MMKALVIAKSSSGLPVPAAIAAAGEKAGWRFVEYFTANIRNRNTREAYWPGGRCVLRVLR
jgi:hypothetical protein